MSVVRKCFTERYPIITIRRRAIKGKYLSILLFSSCKLRFNVKCKKKRNPIIQRKIRKINKTAFPNEVTRLKICMLIEIKVNSATKIPRLSIILNWDCQMVLFAVFFAASITGFFNLDTNSFIRLSEISVTDAA